MAAILGGYGDATTPDIMGGTQTPYVAPPPPPYTYTVPTDTTISGVPGGTVFTGDEARRVESYVTGVQKEQAIWEANQPTFQERIQFANQQTIQAIKGGTQAAGDFAAAPFGVPLPLVAAVGLLFLAR